MKIRVFPIFNAQNTAFCLKIVTYRIKKQMFKTNRLRTSSQTLYKTRFRWHPGPDNNPLKVGGPLHNKVLALCRSVCQNYS